VTVIVHQWIGVECRMRSLEASWAIVRPHYGVVTDICFTAVASRYRNCVAIGKQKWHESLVITKHTHAIYTLSLNIAIENHCTAKCGYSLE
jgi:hypothetical protein